MLTTTTKNTKLSFAMMAVTAHDESDLLIGCGNEYSGTEGEDFSTDNKYGDGQK